MFELIIYVSGIVTSVSFIGLIYFRNRYLGIKNIYQSLETNYKNLLKEKTERESLKRLAKYKTTGWHFTSETNDPNKKTWDVFFELKEVALSVDEKESKFEVISVTSMGEKDTWSKEDYTNWFLKKTGGGWIQNNSPNLEWITTMSKSEARDLKLKDLGI